VACFIVPLPHIGVEGLSRPCAGQTPRGKTPPPNPSSYLLCQCDARMLCHTQDRVPKRINIPSSALSTAFIRHIYKSCSSCCYWATCVRLDGKGLSSNLEVPSWWNFLPHRDFTVSKLGERAWGETGGREGGREGEKERENRPQGSRSSLKRHSESRRSFPEQFVNRHGLLPGLSLHGEPRLDVIGQVC